MATLKDKLQKMERNTVRLAESAGDVLFWLLLVLLILPGPRKVIGCHVNKVVLTCKKSRD